MSDRKRQYPRSHRDIIDAEGRASSRLDWRCYEEGAKYDIKELIAYISYLKSTIIDYEYNEGLLYEKVEDLEKRVDDLLTEVEKAKGLLSDAFFRCDALQEELNVLKEELAGREAVIADLAKNLGIRS